MVWLSSYVVNARAQALPKAADDGSNAQWSHGIDQVLRCALYLRLLLPRTVTNARSDASLFANRFRPEIAALFMALAVLLTDPQATDAVAPGAVVAAALAAADGLTHSGSML